MESTAIKPILEAAIMAAEAPVPMERLLGLFSLLDEGAPSAPELEAAIAELQQDYAGHGVELVGVAGGYRFQTRAEYADWVNRLWEERKPRYSRALLETIAIIAYRQPITRSEIEDIRGVAVSTGIMKTLLDRDWVKVVGHRDVPGRPAIYATTRQFLEYFNLASLDALPTLAELRDIDGLNPDLFAETGVDYPAGEAPDTPAEEAETTTSDASGDGLDEASEEAESPGDFVHSGEGAIESERDDDNEDDEDDEDSRPS
ncbi:MAG: SMC-Scp complex subunit ScpB [Gammaproteobacteria bacterium]|nr:SMC-Scp complex subunit ScpB [Gammaproteobacteria bacterium]